MEALIFGIIVCIVTLWILFPFVANALAKRDLFFTRLESGDIKFITRGDTLYKIVNDTKGDVIGGTNEKNPFNKKYGLYWIGIPPFGRIHKFKITKTKENPNGDEPANWITSEEEVEVSSLRYTLTRPYVLKEVELQDRTPITLLVVTKFEVVDPYIPVFNLKGRFFENAGSIVKAGVIDVLKNFTLDDFVKQDKGEVNGILKDMKLSDGSLNEVLEKQVGLRLVGISISQYDPSDKDVRTAMNAQVIAEETGKATVATANFNAKKIKIEAEAEANRIEIIGKAQGVKVKELVANLASSLGKPDIIATSAANILKAEKISESDITTWVENGNANILVGGEK